MSFYDLRDSLQGNLRELLPIIMVVLIVLAGALFVGTSIIPRWSTYDELVTNIDGAKVALEAREAEDDGLTTIQILQQQIDSARPKVAEAAAVLVTEAQADGMLDHLFGYAADSGVDITYLQAQQAAQAAEHNEYDTRVFRLQVAGSLQELLVFVARIREAMAPSVVIQGLEIRSGKTGPTLMFEVLFYTSPFASGDILADLPQTELTTEVVQSVSPSPEPPTQEVSGVEVTSVTYLAAPLPLNLLYVDTFDSGVMYVWDVGQAWSFVNVDGGQALQITGSHDPVTFRHSTLQDSAVQVRFHLDAASARLSLRESEAGSYTGLIDTRTQEVSLYRGSTLIQSVALPPSPEDKWYTVQLSAVDDIIRLVVDNTEYIAIRDLAPLPPGTASFALIDGGVLLVDDFMLWAKKHSDTAGEAN